MGLVDYAGSDHEADEEAPEGEHGGHAGQAVSGEPFPAAADAAETEPAAADVGFGAPESGQAADGAVKEPAPAGVAAPEEPLPEAHAGEQPAGVEPSEEAAVGDPAAAEPTSDEPAERKGTGVGGSAEEEPNDAADAQQAEAAAPSGGVGKSKKVLCCSGIAQLAPRSLSQACQQSTGTWAPFQRGHRVSHQTGSSWRRWECSLHIHHSGPVCLFGQAAQSARGGSAEPGPKRRTSRTIKPPTVYEAGPSRRPPRPRTSGVLRWSLAWPRA